MLSKESRRRIPTIIKQLDYQQEFEILDEYFMKKNSSDELFCFDLIYLNKSYKQLIKTDLPKIMKELKGFEKIKIKLKDQYHDMLQIGVNILNKTSKKKQDIIPFILSKGVENTFQDLLSDSIKPQKEKVKLPDLPELCLFDNRPSIVFFIDLLYKYVDLQQNNQNMIAKQKQIIPKFHAYEYFKLFKNLKQQFITNYSRSISCLNNQKNIFDYFNKNNIQVILKFLRMKEIGKLLQTSRSMKSLVTQGIESYLLQLNTQITQVLQSLNISDLEAKASMYIQHFNLFKTIYSSHFTNAELCYKPYSDMIYALCQVIPSDLDRIKRFIKDTNSRDKYALRHNIETAMSDKIDVLDQTLSLYTDSYIEKTGRFKGEDYHGRDNPIILQKYLKGLRLYIQINKRQEFKQIQSNYVNQVQQIDRKIHQYERIIGLNKELLLLFTLKWPSGYIKSTERMIHCIFNQ